jgi:7-cyano-7-deazaguanine synthase
MDISRHATVLMSGGIDSAACAAFLINQGLKVSAVFVDHGQAAANFERIAVRSLAAILKIEVQELALTGAAPFGSGELVGRNAFLVFSAIFATRARSSRIALGLHAGTQYYDCSPAFIETINRAVAEHTDNVVQVVAPFLEWTKRDVYDYFVQVGLPIELTYSCESGGMPTCGSCASCQDRKALQC